MRSCFFAAIVISLLLPGLPVAGQDLVDNLGLLPLVQQQKLLQRDLLETSYNAAVAEGNSSQALKIKTSMLELTRQVYGSHPETAEAEMLAGDHAAEQQKFELATKHFQSALKILESQPSKDLQLEELVAGKEETARLSIKWTAEQRKKAPEIKARFAELVMRYQTMTPPPKGEEAKKKHQDMLDKLYEETAKVGKEIGELYEHGSQMSITAQLLTYTRLLEFEGRHRLLTGVLNQLRSLEQKQRPLNKLRFSFNGLCRAQATICRSPVFTGEGQQAELDYKAWSSRIEKTIALLSAALGADHDDTVDLRLFLKAIRKMSEDKSNSVAFYYTKFDFLQPATLDAATVAHTLEKAEYGEKHLPDHPCNAYHRLKLALHYLEETRAGRPSAKAVTHCRQALLQVRNAAGPRHGMTTYVINQLLNVLQQLSRKCETAELAASVVKEIDAFGASKKARFRSLQPVSEAAAHELETWRKHFATVASFDNSRLKQWRTAISKRAEFEKQEAAGVADKATATARQVLAVCEELFPAGTLYKLDLVISHAKLLMQLKQNQQAIQLLERTIEWAKQQNLTSHVNYPVLLALNADAAVANGENTKAAEYYKTALPGFANAPEWRQAINGQLGRIAFQRGHLKAAEEHFRNANWQLALGEVLHKCGETEQAIQVLQEIQASHSGRLQDPASQASYGGAAYWLGRVYADGGKPTQAIAELEKGASYFAQSGLEPMVFVDFYQQHLLNNNEKAAEEYLDKYFAWYEKRYGKDSPEYANGLQYVGLAPLTRTLMERIKTPPLQVAIRSEKYLLQALEAWRKVDGEASAGYSRTCNSLGCFYQVTGRHAESAVWFRKELELLKTLKTEGRREAEVLNCLAVSESHAGNYEQAERLFRRSLELTVIEYGKDSPNYGNRLYTIGMLYGKLGDYARQERNFRDGLRLLRKHLGPANPVTVRVLYNLGLVYIEKRQFATAEMILLDVARTSRKVDGPRSLSYALKLHSVAELYESMGRHEEALKTMVEVTSIAKTIPPSHSIHASSATLLGVIYRSQGDIEKAGGYFNDALARYKKLFGENHSRIAAPLLDVADYHSRKREYGKALKAARQSMEITARFVQTSGSLLSERQQLALAKSQRRQLDMYLSIASRAGGDEAGHYAFVLRWKGGVLVRQRELRRAENEAGETSQQLRNVTRELAWLSGFRPGSADASTWVSRMQELMKKKDELEQKIAQSGKPANSREITLKQLQDAIPSDAALVDFIEYNHFATGEAGGSHRRVSMFVVHHTGPVVRVDLGKASHLDDAVKDWRHGLQAGNTRGDLRLGNPTLAEPVDGEAANAIWKPLQPHVHRDKMLLISPDGVLSQCPFAALPLAGGRYLLEDKAVVVIPAPQLLPEMLAEPVRHPRPTGGKYVLLLGDVKFKTTVEPLPAATNEPAAELFASRGNRATRRAVRGKDAGHAPLPGTAVEIAGIEKVLGRQEGKMPVVKLKGAGATEHAIRQQAGNALVVHFATHGYFADSSLTPASDEDSSLTSLTSEIRQFHPDLLSGLVLAGADNETSSSVLQDDGILTAFEVASLNMPATRLAVLSACETGLGRVAGGEGVLGLQRAFQIAGVDTTVTSLWQVHDRATQALMVEFYSNLFERKLGYVESLRQAQLTMLNRYNASEHQLRDTPGKKRAAAVYWAAFTLSGDWR